MKRNIFRLISTCLKKFGLALVFMLSVCASSTAMAEIAPTASTASTASNAGILHFFNDSAKPVSVVLTAGGCFKVEHGMLFVCHFEEKVDPGSDMTYIFGWGTTRLGMNVQSALHHGWEESGEDQPTYTAPCTSADSEYCYLRHQLLSLKSGETTDFHFTG